MALGSSPVELDSLPHAAEQQISRPTDDNGETIMFEARLLRPAYEHYLREKYRTSCFGFLFCCLCNPCGRRQARKVADSWRLYVTENTICFNLVDRNICGCTDALQAVQKETRIALTDIRKIAVNNEIECTCCGGGKTSTLVVTYKKVQERYVCFGFYRKTYTSFTFDFVANAEEFAEAVRRQMAALRDKRY